MALNLRTRLFGGRKPARGVAVPAGSERRGWGALLQSRGSVFGEDVFLCRQGRRHWIRDLDHLRAYGFRWPDDLIQVSEAVLAAFRPAGPAPMSWCLDDDAGAIASSLVMREFVASKLHGEGLEVGAGASPFPVPLQCRVAYGDRLRHEELVGELYPGQRVEDLIIPDLVTDFDTFEGVADASLDFIIGCHVIEHARNPIGAIAAAHSKLRRGGKLLLVVPDMERTFDRTRPITTLEHLREDFEQPDRGRDLAHYLEFYRLAQPVPEARLAEVAEARFASAFAIHYHAWNHAAFAELIDYIAEDVVAWTDVWSHPALPDSDHDIEFYFLLTK